VPRLLAALDGFPGRVHVVDGRRGPAAARNAGWRRSDADWIAFLDDDVVPEPGWVDALVRDLRTLPPEVAGSQGRIRVPLPDGRRPTDWERCVHGLEDARWATADMAYRRSVLEELDGFDEGFPRAYREDADLALRVLRAGYELQQGTRCVVHPVGAAGPLISVRKQAGNADDVRMRAKHGPSWRAPVGAGPGRLRRHAAVAAAGLVAAGAAAAGRRHLALIGLALWGAGTAELAAARIAPGPRTPKEVATMLATSVALPFVAVAYAAAGWARHLPLARARRQTAAVLFDRDGTLVENVPWNADPARVRLMPGARQAVMRVRAAGLPVAVVTNQSVIGRGMADATAVASVHERITELLGPLDDWLVCPHAPEDGCNCRKPRPGLVVAAAERLGVRPRDCVVIGDIGSDVEAAHAAGARSVLVPTRETRPDEVRRAPLVAPTLCDAIDLVLRGRT
jgi:histidinol-phosphate phosphatase family protein